MTPEHRRDHLQAATTPPDAAERRGDPAGARPGPPRRPTRATVIPCADGPTLVQGATTVIDTDGRSHDTWRPIAAVCRCGKSSLSPWCDGTHKVLRKAWRPQVEAAAHTGGRVVLTAVDDTTTDD